MLGVVALEGLLELLSVETFPKLKQRNVLHCLTENLLEKLLDVLDSKVRHIFDVDVALISDFLVLALAQNDEDFILAISFFNHLVYQRAWIFVLMHRNDLWWYCTVEN